MFSVPMEAALLVVTVAPVFYRGYTPRYPQLALESDAIVADASSLCGRLVADPLLWPLSAVAGRRPRRMEEYCDRVGAMTLAVTSEKVQNSSVNATKEVQWSELQRDPKAVAALADAGDVRVRRRDGADLLLTREDRLASSGEGAITAVRALRSLLAHAPVEVAVEALTEEFPWLSLLPADDRSQFVDEFIRAARISAELGQWSVLTELLRGWRATAMIYTDPELLRQLSEPLSGDFGPVPAPVEVDPDGG